MSIITDFFAASSENLPRAFPGWMEVGPKNRPMKNPMTGEIQMAWAPAGPPPVASPLPPPPQGVISRLFRPQRDMPSTAPRYVDLFPTFQSKGVDVVKLCTLQMIIADSTFEEALASYDKPALISPNDEEEQLYELPSALTEGLFRLADNQVTEVAQKWVDTEELRRDQWSQSDAKDVIQSLRSLARKASHESTSVYHYWSL